MCCCNQPNINGQLGYKWQLNDTPSIRRPSPPELGKDDELIYDEPGRCGEMDAHSHHYRVVKGFSSTFLLVQHGGGKESLRLSVTKTMLDVLGSLDSNARYWMLHTIAHAYSNGKQDGAQTANSKWQFAAVDKRIKTRKCKGYTKVWIEPQIIQQSASPLTRSTDHDNTDTMDNR